MDRWRTFGLEKAVLGMKENGTRAATIPYELLEAGTDKTIDGIQIIKNQDLVLTLKVTEIEPAN